MRVSNIKCRQFVTACEPFQGSNLSGVKMLDNLYIVYSYGWYPIYACIDGQWYGHENKYSVSTSKHQSQAKPVCNDICMLNNETQLRDKIAAASQAV